MADEREGLNVEKAWEMILTTGREYKDVRRVRNLLKLVPREPRCRMCNAPFAGLGGALVKLVLGKEPARANALFCNACEVFARKHPGGAEVELAMLFADVRGSTGLAEKLGVSEFRDLIDRFYRTATDVLVHSNALIEKLAGDEVTALFVRGFAGEHYTLTAIEASWKLMQAVSRGRTEGPGIAVGVGVHFGRAFVGAVGESGGMVQFVALGDAVNTTARLASVAGAGEILVSEDALSHAGMEFDRLERRELSLKGRSAPVAVRVMR
jgi:adenylate cyclase